MITVFFSVANVLVFLGLVGSVPAVAWVCLHLPAVVQPGEISLYLQRFWVVRALLRPLWMRGRYALSGLTNSPLPRECRRAALPEGDSRATTGSASWGRGRIPSGLLADLVRTPPVAARLAAAVIGVPMPCVPAPVGAHGMGSKPPVDHVDRTAALPQHVPTVFVITAAGTWALRPGGAVEFVSGESDKAPGSAAVQGTAVVGGTRAPGDGPQLADPTGGSANATPSSSEGSGRRGGTFSFLAYMFGVERPAWLETRGRVGEGTVPTATPAVPVEPAERSRQGRSALLCSRRRGGPQALAEVPLPRQPADHRESVAVPPRRARAGRPEPAPIGE